MRVRFVWSSRQLQAISRRDELKESAAVVSQTGPRKQRIVDVGNHGAIAPTDLTLLLGFPSRHKVRSISTIRAIGPAPVFLVGSLRALDVSQSSAWDLL